MFEIEVSSHNDKFCYYIFWKKTVPGGILMHKTDFVFNTAQEARAGAINFLHEQAVLASFI